MSIWRTKGKVEVESVVPDFTLPSQVGEMVSLKDFIGRKPVVLFFYPLISCASHKSIDYDGRIHRR